MPMNRLNLEKFNSKNAKILQILLKRLNKIVGIASFINGKAV